MKRLIFGEDNYDDYDEYEIVEYKKEGDYLVYVQSIGFTVSNLKKAMSSTNYFKIERCYAHYPEKYKLMYVETPNNCYGKWLHHKQTFFYMVLMNFYYLRKEEIQFMLENINFNDMETYYIEYYYSLKDICEIVKTHPILKDKVSDDMISKLLKWDEEIHNKLINENNKSYVEDVEMIDISNLFVN